MNKRQLILEKGFELLYQKGYNGTGIKEIVEAAGVPKGSFYSYFPSKQAFALEALQHYRALVDAEMQQVLSNKDLPPVQRILDLYARRIKLYRKLKFTLGCFGGNLAQELGDTDETIREALDGCFVHNRQPIVACLEEAQRQKAFALPLPPQQLAEFIVNAYEGALLRMKAAGNDEPLVIFQKMLAHLLQ